MSPTSTAKTKIPEQVVKVGENKMKTFKINIHPNLENVQVTVKNGAKFTRDLITGNYQIHRFVTNEEDAKRIKEFAVKHGNDNNSNKGHWYAHCNGFAMDLVANYNNEFQINTYRPYGRTKI